MPPSFRFIDGALVLPARALVLRPPPTTVALVYTSSAFVAVTALVFGRLRDALTRAERRVFVQSWRLRQLLPDGE